ncbi:MAG: HAD-IC family P-type ATPase [Geothrix sp.]|uniref:cation-translocating P-type ATPase n=1 Tax=Geothrix sp. TaxID=1962974 RepID=UPI003BAFA3F8
MSGDLQLHWHALSREESLRSAQGRIEGLNTPEAQQRLGEDGPNLLPRTSGESILVLLGRQVANPLILVLLGSAVLALLMGKPTDAGVVLAVVVLNALIGFVQEFKAGRAIASLADMVPEQAMVLRDGQRRGLPASELVRGDLVFLQSGDRVPADLRLIEVRDLQVVESALTGESLPVSKAVPEVPAGAALGDRASMAFSGTLVTFGTATGLVVGTGTRTELGHISELMRDTTQVETPLMRDMGRLGKQLTWAVLGVALLVFLVGLVRGWGAADGALAALSLVVAAIPEGLPAVISIALAIGVRRMAQRRSVIRSLPAVETLGSTTVICSDKTGTLTRNEMSVRVLWTGGAEVRVEGVGYAPAGRLLMDGRALEAAPPDLERLLQAGGLCSDATFTEEEGRIVLHGDPTEGALVVAAERAGLRTQELRKDHPRLDVIPFESEHKYMATLHDLDRGRVLLAKGAPEVLLSRCVRDAQGVPLDVPAVEAEAARLAGQGMRVLALAERPFPGERVSHDDVQGLTFLGLQGMIDPPRPESIQAIADCRRAGITVKMITGDHPGTAEAIGRELGLNSPRGAVTGRELDALDAEGFARIAREAHVFARVSPEHKLRLVQALQAQGEVVAMTGDGVNDAPALKRADIGVAMGITGTAVSREAADMVLLDDDFASIRSAVAEGRRVYDNLVKALAFALPTNLGQAMVLLAAVLFFPFQDGVPLLPILPVQILWINLVVTVTLSLPIAFEAPEPSLMERPPRRPGKPLLGRFVLARTILVGSFFALGTLALFLWEVNQSKGLDPELALRKAQTLAVTTLALMQAFYLLNCRSLKDGFWKMGLFTNPLVYGGILVLVLLQVALVHVPPLQKLFHTTALDAGEWLKALGVSLLVLPLVSLEKAFRRYRASERC